VQQATCTCTHSDQRTQLAPERAEMLLFIRENFKADDIRTYVSADNRQPIHTYVSADNTV